MTEKLISWTTRVITGDEAISRALVMFLAITMIALSAYFFLKDKANQSNITIGEESEQLLPSEL